jgi:hypothetical protein
MIDGRVFEIPVLASAIAKRFPAGYIFQQRIRQADEVRHLSGDTASTVRILTLWGSHGPDVIYAVWKLASPDSVADNAWRGGISVCLIDLDSGTIRRAGRSTEDGFVEVRHHGPSDMKLTGFRIPFWSEARDLALAAASKFSDLTMIGWDIAIGENGPVLVEGNIVPDPVLYQIAAGEGLLTSDFEARLADAREAAVERGCPPSPPRPSRLRSGAEVARRLVDFGSRLDVWNLMRPRRTAGLGQAR